MAKRKSKVNPVDPGLNCLPSPPELEPPALVTMANVAIDALADILRCNTARKCHDRARAALAEMEAAEP